MNLSPTNQIRNIQAINSASKTDFGVINLSQIPNAVEFLSENYQQHFPIKVGYYVYMTRKKLELGESKCFMSNTKVHYIPIEPRANLEMQAPFEIIIQKFIDLYKEEDQSIIPQIQKFLDIHNEILVIDSIVAMQKTLERDSMNQLFEQCFGQQGFQAKKFKIRIPFYQKVQNPQKDKIELPPNLQFPILTKAVQSQEGVTMTARSMYICFNKNGLEKAIKTYQDPIIIQEFIQHSGVVFKIYVINRHIEVVKKPSFEDLQPSNEDMIFFNSRDPPPFSQNFNINKDLVNIDQDTLNRCVELLEEKAGLTVYGFDVLVQSQSKDHVVVDINYWPSFRGVANYNDLLEDHILNGYKKFKERMAFKN